MNEFLFHLTPKGVSGEAPESRNNWYLVKSISDYALITALALASIQAATGLGLGTVLSFRWI